MAQESQGSTLRDVIERPKGDTTVNNDPNFTMDCFGNNAPVDPDESLVAAWCQIFFPKLATIPPEPDPNSADSIQPGPRRWRHPALDGSAVESHAGEEHTFVIWFEFDKGPKLPHELQPFSSVFKPLLPNGESQSDGSASTSRAS